MNLKELLREQNNILYCVVPVDGFFYVDEKTTSMEYDVSALLRNLTLEEQKFLVAECIEDSSFLRNFVFTHGILPSVNSIRKLIRTYTEEQLIDVIKAIQYTQNFNAYLCYMLNDWADEFESKEERLKFTL